MLPLYDAFPLDNGECVFLLKMIEVLRGLKTCEYIKEGTIYPLNGDTERQMDRGKGCKKRGRKAI